MNKRVQGILTRFSRLNYSTARAFYVHRLQQTDARFEKPPIIVYQMGKVGSSSITRSLHEVVRDRNIYHIHFLSAERVKEYEKKRKPLLRTRYVGDLQHIWQYVYLRKRLRDNPDEGWKIITLVRDPVARNLATFFEHVEVRETTDQGWHLFSQEYGFDVRISRDNLEPLIELFYEKCRHDAPMNYYDNEFKEVLDIDIFQSAFPMDKGYEILKQGPHEVLAFKLERLNDCHEEAMSKFLDIDNFKLANANIGANKDYADVYGLFKDIIRLPGDYLDRCYDSKMARHFYTPEEIDRFRQRWTR